MIPEIVDMIYESTFVCSHCMHVHIVCYTTLLRVDVYCDRE